MRRERTCASAPGCDGRQPIPALRGRHVSVSRQQRGTPEREREDDQHEDGRARGVLRLTPDALLLNDLVAVGLPDSAYLRIFVILNSLPTIRRGMRSIRLLMRTNKIPSVAYETAFAISIF